MCSPSTQWGLIKQYSVVSREPPIRGRHGFCPAFLLGLLLKCLCCWYAAHSEAVDLVMKQSKHRLWKATNST